MPLTPFHYPIAYLIHKWKQQLSLPALIVSSFTPDLDSLLNIITGERIPMERVVLHSLLGVATLGTFLSVMLTVFLYPSLVSFLFRLDKEKVKEKCRFSITLVVLCLLGGVLHVFVDSLHHPFNPLLYPFINESINKLVLFNNTVYATLVVQSLLLVLLIFIFLREIGKKDEGFWNRVLVG